MSIKTYLLKDNLPSISKEEQVISYYIYKNSPNEDFNDLIEHDDRYFVKYNLTDYRSSILRWYPFTKDSVVLEIGAEYGALTGALCDRCREVFSVTDTLFRARLIRERYKTRNNLTVCTGIDDDAISSKKFDYIILFGALEKTDRPAALLNNLKPLLKKDGLILLEADNKYGIQYLVGKKEKYSGIPFESLDNYIHSSIKHGYNLDELRKIIVDSDYNYYKFYYPLPDYIAPKALFSDSCQPKSNIGERLTSYYEDTSTIIANDRQLFLDIIENGSFSYFANNFIVEVTDDPARITDINMVVLSAYRSRKHSFATIMHDDKTVEKKCLYNEGYDYAKYLLDLTNEISGAGIPILPMKLADNSLFMNFINGKTVQQHLQCLVERHSEPERFYDVFDKMWGYILKSSRHSQNGSFSGIENIGPILSKAYLEMISLNSFWIDNDILFFDQEYVEENYPAKYVQFRSIKYVYLNIPEIENSIEKKDLEERYGINSKLKVLFESMENDLGKRENPYANFFSNSINPAICYTNRRKLLGYS